MKKGNRCSIYDECDFQVVNNSVSRVVLKLVGMENNRVLIVEKVPLGAKGDDRSAGIDRPCKFDISRLTTECDFVLKVTRVDIIAIFRLLWAC